MSNPSASRFVHLASPKTHCLQDNLANYDLTVFAVSTTGQGDFPADAREFWRALLKKKLPPDYLRGVHFTVFGLGDSSYPKYTHFPDLSVNADGAGSIGPRVNYTNGFTNWGLLQYILQEKEMSSIPRGMSPYPNHEGANYSSESTGHYSPGP